MIHYHGTPLSSKVNAAKVLAGRHALISHACPGYVDLAADVCQSFVLDNGAFSHFTKGQPKGIADWFDYYEWSAEWLSHPSCDWAIIPDIIDGSDADNDTLVDQWPHKGRGVPVYHLHESLDRLRKLCDGHLRVALGSSGGVLEGRLGRLVAPHGRGAGRCLRRLWPPPDQVSRAPDAQLENL
jgi:hypothetical protein